MLNNLQFSYYRPLSSVYVQIKDLFIEMSDQLFIKAHPFINFAESSQCPNY